MGNDIYSDFLIYRGLGNLCGDLFTCVLRTVAGPTFYHYHSLLLPLNGISKDSARCDHMLPRSFEAFTSD